MTDTIAYTYLQDVHCLCCTQVAMVRGRFHLPFGKGQGPFARDEKGIICGLTDREGALVLPVFDTDEQFDETRCADCGAIVSMGEPA